MMELISVLSVEPYGMKLQFVPSIKSFCNHFSALGRAVWDETAVLQDKRFCVVDFSALGRAVWDETLSELGRRRRV